MWINYKNLEYIQAVKCLNYHQTRRTMFASISPILTASLFFCHPPQAFGLAFLFLWDNKIQVWSALQLSSIGCSFCLYLYDVISLNTVTIHLLVDCSFKHTITQQQILLQSSNAYSIHALAYSSHFDLLKKQILIWSRIQSRDSLHSQAKISPYPTYTNSHPRRVS